MCMLCFLALLFSIFLMKNQIFVKIMILYVYGSVQVLHNEEGRGRVVVKCLSVLEKMAKNCIKMIRWGGGGGGKLGKKRD